MELIHAGEGNFEESDLTLFEWRKKKFKEAVFKVLHVLVSNTTITKIHYFLLLFVSYVQYLNFPFHRNFEEIWSHTDIYEYLNEVIRVAAIYPLFESFDFNYHLMAMYSIIAYLIFLIILLGYIFYLSLSNKYQLHWPIKAACISLHLLTTVLFIPFLGIFVTIMDCEEVSGKYVLVAHTEIECFDLTHIIHLIFACLFMLIFLILIIPIGLLYFQSFHLEKDISARMDSNGETLQLLLRSVYIIVLNVLNRDEYNWAMSIGLLVGTLLVCLKYMHYPRYYSYNIDKIWNIFNFLELWIAIIAFLTLNISSEFQFEGAVELFLLGIPLVVVYVINLKDNRNELLLMSVHEFEDPNLLCIQIEYFLNIITSKSIDSRKKITLRGYSQRHYATCKFPDCPISVYLSKQRAALKQGDALKKTKEEYLADIGQAYAILIIHANKLYLNALIKFPNDNKLRLNYAVFLIEKLNNAALALNELKIVEEKGSLDLEEEFLTFRYKKIIKAKILDLNNVREGSNDIYKTIAFETHHKGFMNKIERCGIMHLHFWGILEESVPDMNTLRKSGFRIGQLILQIEDHWEKIQMLNPDDPKLLRMYAHFLIAVLNDKQYGEEILNKAKDESILMASNLRARRFLSTNLADINAFSSDGSACVYVSGHPNKEGCITECNMSFCRMFGYKKNDLIGNNIDMLMPNFYKGFHTDILRKTVSSGKTIDPYSGGKERKVFCLDSNGYVFPSNLKIASYPSILNGNNFIAQFFYEKRESTTNIGHVLFDTSGKIRYVSSSCMYLFGLNTHSLNINTLDISVLVPELGPSISRNELYFSKAGKDMVVFIPERKEELREKRKRQEIRARARSSSINNLIPPLPENRISRMSMESDDFGFIKGSKSIVMNIQLMELKVKEILYGYSMKLEYINASTTASIVMQKDLTIPWFQLRYDEGWNRFFREARENPRDAAIIESSMKLFFPAPSKQHSIRRVYGENLRRLKTATTDKSRGSFLTSGFPNTARQRTTRTRNSVMAIAVDRENSVSGFGQNNDSEDKNEEFEMSDFSLESEDLDDSDKMSKMSKINGKLSHLTRRSSAYYTAIMPKIKQISRFVEEMQTNFNMNYFLKDITDMLEKRCFEFGKNIKTFRLIDGEFVGINEEASQLLKITQGEQSELLVEEATLQRKKKEEAEKKTFIIAYNIKSRKDLENIILEGTKIRPLSIVNKFSFFLLATIIAFTIVEYFTVMNFFTYISENLNLVNWTSHRPLIIMNTLYYARQLILIQEGIIITDDDALSISFCKTKLNESIQELTELEYQISSATLQLSNADDYYNFTYNHSTVMHFQDIYNYQHIKTFTLHEAILQYITAINKVVYLETENLSEENSHIYFLLKNGYNELLIQLSDASDFYLCDFKDETGGNDSVELGLFLSISIFGFLLVPIFILLMRSIELAREQILRLFMILPSKYIRIIKTACEGFINTITFDKNDLTSLIGSDDDQEKEEEEEVEFAKYYTHKRRRKYKNIQHLFKVNLLYILIGVIIIEVYFVTNFLLLKNVKSNFETFINGFNNTLHTVRAPLMSLNYQREYYYNPDATFQNVQVQDLIEEHIQLQLKITKGLENKQNWQKPVVGSEMMAEITELQEGDVCSKYNLMQSLYESYSINSTCDKYLDGVTKEGLDAILPYFFQISKSVHMQYYDLRSKYENEEVIQKSIFSFISMSELNQIVELLIEPMIDEILTLVNEGITHSYEFRTSRRLGTLIGFLVFFFLVFIALWVPFLRSVKTSYMKTKKMLAIIPLEVMLKVKHIHEYVERQALKTNSK